MFALSLNDKEIDDISMAKKSFGFRFKESLNKLVCLNVVGPTKTKQNKVKTSKTLITGFLTDETPYGIRACLQLRTARVRKELLVSNSEHGFCLFVSVCLKIKF